MSDTEVGAGGATVTTTSVPAGRRGFLRRMTFACAWGEGLDGFDLGLISVTLPAITTALGLDPVLAGLIGASSLIGIFIGAPLAGWLTDRFGRRRVFTVDVIAFIVLGLLQAVVADGWQLFAVRVLLGIAIGAEYAIGAAMLAEFAPSNDRGRRLSGLLVCWYAGYLAAVVAAYVMIDAFGLGWRWVLVTSAVPAVVTAIARIGFPESPRWLLSHGRPDEARAVVAAHLGGDDYFRDEQYAAEEQRAGGYRVLFSKENRQRLAFISLFWACNVAPYFAIFTFAPTVLDSLHLSNAAAGTITVNAMAAIGALVGMLTIERMGRRRQLIPPFWIMAVALAVVGLWGSAPGIVVVLCFAVFSFMNAAQGNLTAVYPIEVLPTEVRSTGVGFAAACSRVGAAAGTFLLPVGISTIGVGVCMLIAAAICVAGALLSQAMAPETTGRGLHDTSTQPLRQQPSKLRVGR
ncbi:MFS transporter [Curtobacterium sp. 22159]|uniref:MFS transporter n=1 Tax=Curtobacterium sp. 22159 TaxID=3453882 RepID=UPI003F87D73F